MFHLKTYFNNKTYFEFRKLRTDSISSHSMVYYYLKCVSKFEIYTFKEYNHKYYTG